MRFGGFKAQVCAGIGCVLHWSQGAARIGFKAALCDEVMQRLFMGREV